MSSLAPDSLQRFQKLTPDKHHARLMGMFELFNSYQALEVMSKHIGESLACGRTIES